MLDLDPAARAALWLRTGEILESHLASMRDGALVPSARADDVAAMRAAIEACDHATPTPPLVALERAAAALRDGHVRATDPRYFGLFHPAPSAMAIVAAALVAAFDPQLATEGHAPWPVALERNLVRRIGARFGYALDEADGVFTSGGAEANATALQCALARAFPALGTTGLRALDEDPVLYASTEAHPTIARAARLAGLGEQALRRIPVDAHHRIKLRELQAAIAADARAGAKPFLIVGTAGTTASGAIDPLGPLADAAARHGCWLHVDAAWGGLAAFLPELLHALEGAARADSIAFDPHKALAAPLGTGMLLTRHGGALESAFAPLREHGGYMPRGRETSDPYARAMPWSRRFAGLGLHLTLAVAGFEGVAAALRGQVTLAARLREGLVDAGFRVVNDTPLPLVCFVDARVEGGDRAPHLEALARAAISAEAGWLSVTRFADGRRALRACVDNHRTEARDVDRLIATLAAARA